ncbi:MAG: hypothetical protein NWR37_03420, partial [Algoriphagus sp.]|nr:hypothetical protein [Algoriphagus sp.]
SLHASPMITPTVKTGQPHKLSTKVGGNKFILALYKVPSTMYKVGIQVVPGTMYEVQSRDSN